MRNDHRSRTEHGAQAQALERVRRAARRGAERVGHGRGQGDGLVRETFTLPREEARSKARDFLDRWPTAAYWSRVEHWQALDDGRIRFTMARLPTAD